MQWCTNSIWLHPFIVLKRQIAKGVSFRHKQRTSLRCTRREREHFPTQVKYSQLLVNGFVARPTRNAQERLRPRSAAGNTGVATPFTTALLDQPRILPLPPGLGHFITRFIPQLLSKVQGSQGRRECSAHGQYVRPDPHHLHDLLLDRAQALLQGSG